MRTALQDSLGRDRLGPGRTDTIPPPTGGWNTRDNVANMDEIDATILNNWYPRIGQLVLRGGSESWATGMSGTVKSLFLYSPPVGTQKFYAVTNAGVYDITVTGAVGAVVKALTNGYIHGVGITNSAGSNYFWFANGVDKPVVFDGTTWTSIDASSTPAITGITTTNIVFPWLFKHRIWLVERDTLNAWFLPLDSIGGAAQKFPLGNLFKKGGYLVAGASWTLDAGDGPDDLCVFVTSEGEAAVYKGIDPTSASSWALVGVWQIGKPLSRRCFKQLAGDVSINVESGNYMLSTLLKSGEVNFSNALSNKIQPTFTGTVAFLGPTTEGWETQLYPRFDAMIVNVPSQSVQWVMNTITGAWCSFSEWAANCFEVKDATLFFGITGGIVKKAWDGILLADDGGDITATAHQASNYFGGRTKLKKAPLFQPLLAYDGPVETRYAISPDYADVNFNSTYLRTGSNPGTPWDTSPWDTSPWSPSVVRAKFWRSAAHFPGYALALWLQTASNKSNLAWSGTNFIIADGGAM